MKIEKDYTKRNKAPKNKNTQCPKLLKVTKSNLLQVVIYVLPKVVTVMCIDNTILCHDKLVLVTQKFVR